jgi:hypothetical protein
LRGLKAFPNILLFFIIFAQVMHNMLTALSYNTAKYFGVYTSSSGIIKVDIVDIYCAFVGKI